MVVSLGFSEALHRFMTHTMTGQARRSTLVLFMPDGMWMGVRRLVVACVFAKHQWSAKHSTVCDQRERYVLGFAGEEADMHCLRVCRACACGTLPEKKRGTPAWDTVTLFDSKGWVSAQRNGPSRWRPRPDGLGELRWPRSHAYCREAKEHLSNRFGRYNQTSGTRSGKASVVASRSSRGGASSSSDEAATGGAAVPDEPFS